MRLLHTIILGSLSCDTLFTRLGIGRLNHPGVLRRLYRLSARLPIQATCGPSPRDAARVRSAGKKKPGEGGFRPGFPITDKSFVADSTPHN